MDPFRTSSAQPGQNFGTVGIPEGFVVVPETKVYTSEDGQSRRYIAGDRITAGEAALFGMSADQIGETSNAGELTTAEVYAHVRSLGYQVSPMAVKGPMNLPPSIDDAVAHLQSQGFEVQKAGDATVEGVLAPAGVPEGQVSDAGKATDGTPATGPDAKAEAAPANKAEPAPAAKKG